MEKLLFLLAMFFNLTACQTVLPPIPPTTPVSIPNESSSSEAIPIQSTNEWAVKELTSGKYQMELQPTRGFPEYNVFPLIQDEKLILFNKNGVQISKNEYDIIPEKPPISDEETVQVMRNGKAGLVSATDGAILVPFEWEMVESVENTNYYCVEKDKVQYLLRKNDLSIAYTLQRGDHFEVLGQERELLYQNGTLKLFDKKGTPIKNLVCDTVRVVAQDSETIGVNRLVVQNGSKMAIYDGDGEMITNSVYDDFSPHFKGDYISFRKGTKWGILDYSGTITIKPHWDDIILFDHSASLCLENKWTATTELDKDPEVITPIYDDVGAYSEAGYASFEKDGKYGLLDDEGNVIMNPRQNGRIITGFPGFDEDVFLVQGDNGTASYGVFTDGEMVIPTDNLIYSKEGEAYNLVCTPSGKWGYIDGRGQYIIDTKFEAADSFTTQNIAMVKLNGKICLIDRKGNVVLQTDFDDCVGLNRETMVCAMRYTDTNSQDLYCLVQLFKTDL